MTHEVPGAHVALTVQGLAATPWTEEPPSAATPALPDSTLDMAPESELWVAPSVEDAPDSTVPLSRPSLFPAVDLPLSELATALAPASVLGK
jgi:hypothetical protein